MENKLLIQLPFRGFYNTIHEGALDDILERYICPTDDQGEPPEGLLDVIWRNNWFNWQEARLNYARAYAERFNEWLDVEHNLQLGLTFESIDSPKEYNFSTDRLFAYVSPAKAGKLITYVMTHHREALEQQLKDSFTPCDGFIPFYSNDITDWEAKLGQGVEKLDHNELGMFLACLFSRDDEFELMHEVLEDTSSNGASDYGDCLSKAGWEYINNMYYYEENELSLGHWGIFGQDLPINTQLNVS